jgi:outer membrane lipoprotein-sorting protein
LIRKRCLGALLALPFGLPLAAVPAVREVVERFDVAQSKVETLQSPFTLTTRRALLKTPTVTKGTLYIQGSEFVHFAFAPPEDLILHLTPKALISFSPGAKEGEMLKIGYVKNANRQFLGLGQKLSYLSDYFSVSCSDSKDPANTFQLTLNPRSLSMKKRLESMQIWVDRETYLPRQVQWIERGGDTWFLELGLLQINQPIPPSVSGFKVPEGITLRSEFSFFATRKQ